MTWRRIAPWLIVVIGVLAIYIDLPRKSLHIQNVLPAPGFAGKAKTVLGLDLQGGIQVTLKVKPQPGEKVSADDVAVYAQMMLGRGSYGNVRVLSPRTVDLMTQPVAVPGGWRGLGWISSTEM